MAFQFQAVGAMGPALETAYSVGLAEIGFAIGLYFLPGAVIALPGSAIGARFGERPVVAVSLVLMAFGGGMMALSETWSMFIAGQALAGIGGVTLNILMTKMAADWFAGHEIATAMSIFINSWPLGIALALVVLPPLIAASSISAAFWMITALSALFALLVLVLYRAPARSTVSTGSRRPTRNESFAAVLSGAVWGLFNAGLAVVFGFGTALLVEQGTSLESAARITSLVVWTTTIVSPFGGIIADRVRNVPTLIAGGLVALALFTSLAGITGGAWWFFVLIGVATGTVAGAIMSLPATVLPAETRTIGMGLFFTVYYVSFVASPPLAGFISDLTGQASTAFWLGAAFQVAALVALIWFTKTARRMSAP